MLGDAYKAVELRLLGAIHQRFRLPPNSVRLTARIKAADQVAAYCEAIQLAGFSPDEAARFFGPPPARLTRALEALSPLRSREAQAMFVARFEALNAMRSGMPAASGVRAEQI